MWLQASTLIGPTDVPSMPNTWKNNLHIGCRLAPVTFKKAVRQQ